MWISDSKKAVKTILDSSSPANWNSWNRFDRVDWKFAWNRRESNQAADSAAKYSLDNNCSLSCDEFSFANLPICIVNNFNLDLLSAAV